jgi:glycogen synthase
MSSDRSCDLLFVGRPVPEKGLPDLLDALAAIADLPWRLSVAGDVAPFAVAHAMIRDRISFLGRVSQTEVASIMQRHDVLVVPSRYETFGNVALEGLAVGMVVVASRVGGLKQLIADGRTGFHFEPANVADLEHILRFVMGNFSALSAVRRHARLEAAKYSWPRIVAATHNLLASLT